MFADCHMNHAKDTDMLSLFSSRNSRVQPSQLRKVVLRLLCLCVLLTLPFLTAAAQDAPIITITPDTGQVEVALMTVAIEGLQANLTYTIEFVFDNEVVFASDETSDDEGFISYPVSSTEGDLPGIYTVQVLLEGEVIASADFELTAGSEDDMLGDVSVSPEEGPIGTVHTLRIAELDAQSQYTVEITASETQQVGYRRNHTSDDKGVIEIEVFAEAGDTPGHQAIAVYDSEGELIAEGEFSIDAPPERSLVVEVIPAVIEAGRRADIKVSGLAPFDSVSAQIKSADDVLIDSLLARASSAGEAALTFAAPADMANGSYDIEIFVEGEELAGATLTIGEAAEGVSDAALAVEPAVAAIGSEHRILASGLQANQEYRLTIIDPAGEEEYSTVRSADSEGQLSLTISSTEEDDVGEYTVELRDETSAMLLTEARLEILPMPTGAAAAETISESSAPAIAVHPQAAEIGTTHSITLSGMPAGERIGVVIRARADGMMAESSVATIDARGNAAIEFTSIERNIPGEYAVSAVVPSGDLATATLTIEGAIASIEPQSALIGSIHLITVRDLDAGETVTFDVTFAGETVYSTDKTADNSGTALLELVTSEGDEPGDYTVSVLRESGNQPSVVLTARLEEAAAPPTVVSGGDADVIDGKLDDGSAKIDIEGEQGQYLLITVSSEDFDPAAALVNRDDFEIAYNDTSRGRKNAVIGPLKLPYSGSYALEVFPLPTMAAARISEGDFVTTLETVSLARVDFNSTINFSLSPDVPALYYEMPVNTGDSLSLSIDSDGSLDTLMQVFAPDGFEFVFDDDSGSGFDAELSNLIFDRGATYVLTVSTFDGSATGSGTLTITRNPVHDLEDGEIIIRLNDKAIRDLVVFDAAEDEMLILQLDKLAGDVEDLYVTATVEGMEVMSYSTMGVPERLPLAFVMPMSGRVVVTLEKFGFDDGISLAVSLERP